MLFPIPPVPLLFAQNANTPCLLAHMSDRPTSFQGPAEDLVQKVIQIKGIPNKCRCHDNNRLRNSED